MIFNLVFLNLAMALIIDFKPLMLTLSFTFPKFVRGNKLPLGSENVIIDTTKEEITIINIVL